MQSVRLFVIIKNRMLTWNKLDIPELDMLNAAQSGAIAFRLDGELTYLIERKYILYLFFKKKVLVADLYILL